jgi:hypothetical protein
MSSATSARAGLGELTFSQIIRKGILKAREDSFCISLKRQRFTREESITCISHKLTVMYFTRYYGICFEIIFFNGRRATGFIDGDQTITTNQYCPIDKGDRRRVIN